MAALQRRPLRPPQILAVDLSRPVIDGPPVGALGRLVSARQPQLRQVVETIAEAADTAQVRALLVRIGRPADSWAHAEELRDAVALFRSRGKRSTVHAQSFALSGNDTLSYYFATAFDEIHLQPMGNVGLTGLASEVPFLADLLEKLDVTAEVDHRHEYKSAANLLTEREFTDAHREAVDRILESHYDQLVEAIATGRGVSHERAKEWIDLGLTLGPDATDLGLVDKIAYRDETVAEVKQGVGEHARLVSDRAFRARGWRRRLRPRRRTGVALVHGSGSILEGQSRRSLMGPVMGSDTVVSGFSQAIRDRRVRAVLFRVDSPGGSEVASDAVWRAVARAREAGKPVVVSMGSVAGSGGYWVSMGADRIVAQPGTLTGSIGVVFTKLVTSALRERFGITTDEAHRGHHALMFSPNHRFSEEQWQQIKTYLDGVYDEFVGRVAEGRGMTRDEAHELAKGRVWTGADAAERGLVDELGGYREAFVALRGLIGLDAEAPLRVRTLPRRALPERLGLRGPDPEEIRSITRAVATATRATSTAPDGAASMPSWVRSVR